MPMNEKHRQMSRVERIRAVRDNMRQRFNFGRVAAPCIDAITGRYYPISYAYGVKNSDYAAGHHTGEDHACPVGSLALATSYGHVVYAGWGGSKWGSAYGNQVVIQMANGKYDYAHNHLAKILVRTGDQVTPGMVVGYTGETGNVTGPHTHFECRRAGGHYGSDVHPIHAKRLQYKDRMKRKKKK